MNKLTILLIFGLSMIVLSCASSHLIVKNQVFVQPNEVANVHVDCPSGTKVFGGGFDIETPDHVKIFASEPTDGKGNIINNGWNLMVQNKGTNARQATVSAICGRAH